MNLPILISLIEALHLEIDASIEDIANAAIKSQGLIYEMLVRELLNFEIRNNRFALGQPLSKRFSIIQKKMEDILEETYTPSVKSYLNTYTTVQQKNVSLQKSYNDIEVETSLLHPARRAAYGQAEYYLTSALQESYIQPAKFLLMQQVANGISINDAKKVLKDWTSGKTEEKLYSIQSTPTLDKYATQIARDTIYKFNGAINDIVAKEHGFKRFIYIGGLVKDSRPLCKKLVSMKRKISLDEMPELIKKYPKGLYPNTNEDNFINVCGGYGCMHTATPVK